MSAIHNDVYDAALAEIATGTSLHLCNAEPATVANLSTMSLGSVTIDGTDFTIADGDTSGRKTTVAAQTGVSITADGTWTYMAISDGVVILATVPLAASKVVYSGGTANVAAFDIELRDPTAA